MSFSGIYVHPMLVYTICPCIEYDVRDPPAYASAPNARLEWAYEPATNPPAGEMTIICMALPRPFVVRPLIRDYDFVTILDLLATTHLAFRDVANAVNNNNNRLPWSSTPSSFERYKWAGLSEQRSPGNWLLHIE
jgi:hypothetical protein